MTSSDPPKVASEWEMLTVTERASTVRFSVQVRPRSSRCAVLGVREGALQVALTAPPADGAANAELVTLIARALDVRRSDVVIAMGASSRGKLLQVNGIGTDEVRLRLSKAKR